MNHMHKIYYRLSNRTPFSFHNLCIVPSIWWTSMSQNHKWVLKTSPPPIPVCCQRENKLGSSDTTLVRAKFYSILCVIEKSNASMNLPQSDEKPPMGIWWKSPMKNVWRTNVNYIIKPYLINVLYSNVGNLKFHIWKYLNFKFFNRPQTKFGPR